MSPTINLPKKKRQARTYNKIAYQKVYQDKRWKRLRKAKLKSNPLCERCEALGKVTQTQEIHHIVPFDIEGDYKTLAFNYNNLQSLCIECHHIVHKQL